MICSSSFEAEAEAEAQLQQTPLTTTGDDGQEVPLFLNFHRDNSQNDINRASFNSDVYFEHLHSRGLGRLLLSAAVLPSTQTLLHQNSKKLPDGIVCVADQQAAGKGRGGNQWTSPLGCLMFTFNKVVKISGDRLPFLQYVMSLAIVQAVQQLAASLLQGSNLDVRIKWPNDIYAAEHAKAQQLPKPATVQREVLLANILTIFEQLLSTLAVEGFGPLRQSYLDAWLHSGQQVTLVEGEGQAASEVQLTVRGITSTGYLLAVDAAGRSFELHPDGNSLDFFKGLVRRKLPP
ncbi:hypothetical protein WJX73_001014 [Symbiochloris irregularis]|uniref:BPL/LPL catalytic domain-containing protein n=1 Tax=Symbiochloris irregularis TaxID=706552 RepID=A0AAW1P3E1_9CHLO